VDTTYYCFGTVAGPHPFPTLVRDFQSVIGREVRAQCLEQEGRLPTHLIACVGGGSNAIGIFADFIETPDVKLIGAEAGGRGLTPGDHSAALGLGSYGVLHGSAQYVLQDADGQVLPAHSIAAGLDYPGVGPEHCLLKDTGRARYETVSDIEAVRAFQVLAQAEGIIPALESAHAVALALKLKGEFRPDDLVVINVSGRGDKDCAEVQELLDQGLV
jgi:tryptophan synthase beta chain